MADETIETAAKALEDRLDTAVKHYESQVQENGKAAESVKADMRKLSEDFESIKSEQSGRLKEIEQQIAQGYQGGGESETVKALGDELTESDAFKEYVAGRSSVAQVQTKNTISDLAVTNHVQPIGEGGFRALNVLDAIPSGQTTANAIEFVREGSYTNSAAPTAEGSAKPESSVGMETKTEPVRTIATHVSLSRQSLDDVPALASYINRRLANGVMSNLQSQVLTGNGTNPNLNGLAVAENHSAFSPNSGDNELDSLNRMKYQVMGNDFDAGYVLINPETMGVLERIKTSDKAYVASAGAAMSYVGNGLQRAIWGAPVVVSNSVPAGKAFVMDSNAVMLFMRGGVSVQMFEQHADNVVKNLVTVRAETRAALATFSPNGVVYGNLKTTT